MKLSRRTNTIILWIISIALLLGMIVTFTPSLGSFGFGGNANQDTSNPAIIVNGTPITELEVARARQNPLYSAVTEGEAGSDLELLLADSLIEQQLIEEASASVKVSNAEVRDAVNEFREGNNVAGRKNDQAYLSLIGNAGFTDQTFREYYKEQLRQQKYIDSLTEGVSVSDAEVQAFYETNSQNYMSDERIIARQIVVSDEELANELLARIQAGEDFATVATENSEDLADRGGALGAAEGESEPKAVGRAALPTSVANAAFALGGEGLTDVISANGRYYIVQVEEFIPSDVRPLEDVREDVEADALAAKQAAVIEAELKALRENAEISVPDNSDLTFNDTVVARVGDEEIMASDLARAVYSSPQVQQALSPENAQIITQLFKPIYLNNLIDQKLAYLGAADLDVDFIGSEAQIAQSALNYVSRDAVASDEAIEEYYNANISQFTVPASAVMKRVNFDNEASAAAFREAMINGADIDTAATDTGGEVNDLGSVRPGDLVSELDNALFQTNAFEELPDSGLEISDILVISETVVVENNAADADVTNEDTTDTESSDAAVTDADTTDAEAETTDDTATDEAANSSEATTDDNADAEATADETAEPDVTEVTRDVYVLLVGTRTPETVRPLSEVRAQVENAVLTSARAELQDNWLASLRETITVENLQAQAEPESESFETTPLEGDDTEATEDTTDATTNDAGEATPEDTTTEDTPSDTTSEETNAADAEDESSTDADDSETDATEQDDAPADTTEESNN